MEASAADDEPAEVVAGLVLLNIDRASDKKSTLDGERIYVGAGVLAVVGLEPPDAAVGVVERRVGEEAGAAPEEAGDVLPAVEAPLEAEPLRQLISSTFKKTKLGRTGTPDKNEHILPLWIVKGADWTRLPVLSRTSMPMEVPAVMFTVHVSELPDT